MLHIPKYSPNQHKEPVYRTMSEYEALTTQTLARRLQDVELIANRLGGNPDSWQINEVGDGNLNLVFIVTGNHSSLVIKQALPYVRVVGEGWPLSTKRSFFEYQALVRQHAMDAGRVPEIFHYDEQQALIVMQYLHPHKILRHSLMQGIAHETLGKRIGQFTARTSFRSSDLFMNAHARKADLALFADNAPMCELTENVVFTDPYFAAELNQHTSPQLDSMVAELRGDVDLLVQSQHLKYCFCSHTECLMHGDLHTGSIMVHESDTKIIDPEFAAYGPSGFDLGMFLGNMLMAYFAQVGHEDSPGARDYYREWILQQCVETWVAFTEQYTQLWHAERIGILYPHSVFSQFGKERSADFALTHRLYDIGQSAIGFAGVEILRRILGIAHIIEFDSIEDDALRAAGESRALQLGRQLIVNRRHIGDIRAVVSMAQQLSAQSFV